MGKHLFFYLAMISLPLFYFACGGDEEPLPRQLGVAERYFPLEVGQNKTYLVDSILLLQTVQGTVYDTALLTVQEVLVDTFTGADGALWYRGERYEKDRNAPDTDYRLTRTFALSADNYTARRQEDNLEFIKLTSPLDASNSWSGNLFDEFRQFGVGGEFLDIYSGWSYRFVDTLTSLEVEGQLYEEVALVGQADIDNLIDLRQAYEVYAPGVGLIESFVDARHTQCQVCCNGDTGPCLDLPWNAKAEKGFILRQRLLSIE